MPLQLSLRENPLVVRFVQEISLNPPSLMELAARVIRTACVPYGPNDLPMIMRDYLETAHCCVNPKCQGKLIWTMPGSYAFFHILWPYKKLIAEGAVE